MPPQEKEDASIDVNKYAFTVYTFRGYLILVILLVDLTQQCTRLKIVYMVFQCAGKMNCDKKQRA